MQSWRVFRDAVYILPMFDDKDDKHKTRADDNSKYHADQDGQSDT